MILKFYACEDTLVSVPGPRAVGQPPRYVGRTFSPAKAGKPAAHPADQEPYEVDSDTDEGRRMKLVCRRDGALYPADAETAKACCVEFVTPTFRDGAWSTSDAAPAAAPAAPPKGPPKKPEKPAPAEPVKESKTNG
jgi:hypothetical protein